MAKLPGLFAKLLGNYGDDIARGVANYGDDVLGAVANYGDDAARAVANYGDDVAGLVADNSGRAVMSPELLSDDFLDAVDDFANHTPVSDTTSHILKNDPNLLIKNGTRGNTELKTTYFEDVMSEFGKPTYGFPMLEGFDDGEDYGFPSSWVEQRTPVTTPPIYSGRRTYRTTGNSFKDLVQRARGIPVPVSTRLYPDDDLPF